jgi:hypothetical protein
MCLSTVVRSKEQAQSSRAGQGQVSLQDSTAQHTQCSDAHDGIGCLALWGDDQVDVPEPHTNVSIKQDNQAGQTTTYD